MKHVIVVLPGAADTLAAAPPASWRALAACGRFGEVTLVTEPGSADGSEVLALLGYRPESPGGNLADCAALGRGEEIDSPLALAPFQRRLALRAAWLSERELSRGIARALGLGIYGAAEKPRQLLARASALLAEFDLLVLEALPPSTGWAGQPLAACDLELLGGLLRLIVARRNLRTLVIATASPGQRSHYVIAGAAISPATGPQPSIDRGEELLPSFLQSFGI